MCLEFCSIAIPGAYYVKIDCAEAENHEQTMEMLLNSTCVSVVTAEVGVHVLDQTTVSSKEGLNHLVLKGWGIDRRSTARISGIGINTIIASASQAH